MIGERYICPHCDCFHDAIRYMPDNQGEYWLLCKACNIVCDLPDHLIVAELEFLQIQIANELKLLMGRTQYPSESGPKRVARRARSGPMP